MKLVKYAGLLIILIAVFGIFVRVSLTFASIDVKSLQPAETITYNEDLNVNGTGRFNSIYIGSTASGVGGVTFFNGTIINASTDDTGGGIPLTVGDDMRIDGMIWRGPSEGTSDDMGLKIADDLNPVLTNINIGSSEFQWNNGYFSGDVYVGNLQGSGVIHPNNISSSNSPSSGQVLSYDGSNFQWINNNGSSGGDITAVSAGSGLSGGGTSGSVTLNLASNYLNGAAYDSRFINHTGNQTLEGNFNIEGDVTLGTSGDTFTHIKQGLVSVDPPTISANANGHVDVTISGVAVGDLVFMTPNYFLVNNLVYQAAYVLSSNTVRIKLRNVTDNNAGDLARNWSYIIIRP